MSEPIITATVSVKENERPVGVKPVLERSIGVNAKKNSPNQ